MLNAEGQRVTELLSELLYVNEQINTNKVRMYGIISRIVVCKAAAANIRTYNPYYVL